MTTTVATAVVRRWLTKVPITLRLRQKMRKEIRAKGMPKELWAIVGATPFTVLMLYFELL